MEFYFSFQSFNLFYCYFFITVTLPIFHKTFHHKYISLWHFFVIVNVIIVTTLYFEWIITFKLIGWNTFIKFLLSVSWQWWEVIAYDKKACDVLDVLQCCVMMFHVIKCCKTILPLFFSMTKVIVSLNLHHLNMVLINLLTDLHS